MRKITSLLTLFLLCVGTVMAQANLFTVSSSALDVSTLANGTSTDVVIHVGGTGVNKWLKEVSAYNEGKDALDQSDAYFIYVLVKDASGNLALKDNDNKYMPKWSGSAKGPFRNEKTSAEAYLFTEVESPTNSYDGDGKAYTLTGSDQGGLPLVYLTGSNRLGVNGNNSQTCESVSFQFFTVTPSLAFETGKVYTIQVRDLTTTSSSYMKRLYYGATHVKAAKGNTPDYFWTFEAADEEGKYYLRNLGMPQNASGKYPAITGTSGQPTYTYAGTAYAMEPHPTNWKKGGFVICASGSNWYGAHTAGVTDGANSRLGTWNAAAAKSDGGSTFVVREIDWTDFAGNMAAYSAAAPTRLNENKMKVRSYQYTLGTEAQIAAAQSNPTVENVTAALGAATRVADIETDKVYRFITSAARTNGAISYGFYAEKDGSINTDDGGRPVITEDYQNCFVNTLYQFVATGTEGKFQLKNLNAGTVMGSASSGSQLQMCGIGYEQWAGLYDVEKPTESECEDDTKMMFHLGDVGADTYINALGGWNSSNVGIFTRNWAGSLDNGNLWQIQEVTEIPVTISVAGWSTLKLPVATTIPSGVNAYYVTSNHGDCVYVEEITGTLPANTPVLLKGTASATYKFAITTSDAVNPGNNKLEGTTAKRQGFSEDTDGDPDIYGLLITPASDDTPASAAFVPAYSAKVTANKAYLPYQNIDFSEAQSTSKFAIVIGGNPTPIETVSKETAANVYFDLSGRRVLYPVRGQVYINSNGKKLIFK